MMSREFLKRIGVLGVMVSLAAAPLAFADDRDKEEKDNGYGQADEATMEGGNAGEEGETEWEEDEDPADAAPGAEVDNGDGVASDPSEAGGVGVEGQEGTQAGDEPDLEEEDDTQTQ